MKRLFALLVFLGLASPAALAQLGVYGGFTSAQLNIPNTSRTNGGTFGVFYDVSHFPLVNGGADVRGSILPTNNYSKVSSITFGPRVVFDLPKFPLRPYGEFLVGEAHVQAGQGVAYTDHNSLDVGAAVGGDLRINSWIDWRVLDYSYSRFKVTTNTSLNSITTGIVIRIPFS